MEIIIILSVGVLFISTTIFVVLYTGIKHKNDELLKSNRQIQEQNEALDAERKRVIAKGTEIFQKNKELLQENKRLEPYKTITNIQDYANTLRYNAEADANSVLRNAEAKANSILGKASDEIEETRRQINQESESIIQYAKSEANKIIDDANNRIRSANREAEKIIYAANSHSQSAHKEAEKIIHDARKETNLLTQQIDTLTKRTQALKNKIEGYGMEYMIPGVGLLDDLAIDYGHTEAGQELKAARAKVRSMFREGRAARCNYVELNRQETAIAFVADAFNGKVEEILSRVRHDNYGKLSQQIQDAAILVNKNGEAFRNARIEPPYVEARLNELKWATIVHELKLHEREEQRAIKEQMRDEAKAQKEIEKARKEAEKEAQKALEKEALAQKIYEEFKAKFDAMSERDKALHAKELAEKETLLAEAEEAIRLAEEKGQRALSMAQQTKQGYVYIISNIGSFGENIYKIGMTRRLVPEDRVRELGDASVPFPFDIHGMVHFSDAPAAESQLHRLFIMGQVNKTNFRKEFFRADLNDIKAAVEKLGGETHWTMVADAAQYRETLRIEERLATDSAYRQQWSDRQIRLEALSHSFPSSAVGGE